MDLAFHRRAFACDAAALIDFGMLQASLSAVQGASAGACAEGGPPVMPLVELLLAGAEWRRSSHALRGAFSLVQSARCRASTQMTAMFTLAFQPSFNEPELGSGTGHVEPSRDAGSV